MPTPGSRALAAGTYPLELEIFSILPNWALHPLELENFSILPSWGLHPLELKNFRFRPVVH